MEDKILIKKGETYQINWFAITIFIFMVITLVYFIVLGVYLYNLMNLKPPNKGESIFLFWTTVLLGIGVLIIVIISLYKIFTHKEPMYEEVRTKELEQHEESEESEEEMESLPRKQKLPKRKSTL
ncbi:MAG: hypothetical protein QXV60_02035, partial [Nitrososphaerota archaeon]